MQDRPGSCGVAAFALALTLVLGVAPARGQTRALPAPGELARAWQAEHVIDYPPALLDHDTVSSWLARMREGAPDLFRVEEIGRSLEGRPIEQVSFGRGPTHILLWSQMHGDEPTATAALIDILSYVQRHRADSPVQGLLEVLTIHVVPMLNPDGAARFQRRNAQGIDINRDALLLQSPEGRALKALRDRLQPALGFNLHNQNWKTSAGKTGKPASFSLLAVALDEARTETPGRTLAKKTCAVIRDALEAFVPGQVARYDDEFEVRAFGDNITKWGTPVVLIETGPLQGEGADLKLSQYNFVAILSALGSVASGAVQQADSGRYETLPMNASEVFTVLVRNASVATGSGIPLFTGDVGLASTRIVRAGEGGGRRTLVQAMRIDDLGDLRVFGGVETVDATGLIVAPSPGWQEGAEVQVTDWRAFSAVRPLAVGAVLDLALLKPTGRGMYRVVRLIPAEKVLGSR